jgi:hypothetical protein
MKDLIGSFEKIEWTSENTGIRGKRIPIGEKVFRILEIQDSFQDTNWCFNGHAGYIIEGSMSLNINGEIIDLNTEDTFVLEKDNPDQKHYPFVKAGNSVRLLLVEDSM